MPSQKYYRPTLCIDLLNLIGDFAGSGFSTLKFTISKKRQFLSDIYIETTYRDDYHKKKVHTRKLTKTRWGIITLQDMVPARYLAVEKNSVWLGLTQFYAKEIRDQMDMIHRILSTPVDFYLIE